MDFITIGQYFNRLQIVLLLMLFVPLLVFIAFYVFIAGAPANPEREHVVVIPCAVLLTWSAALVIPNKKIKSARIAQGLGAKLEKYFRITIVRHAFLSAASLALALGLYLTASELFTWLYLGGMGFSLAFWPTSGRVCRDLALRGDEREMVYFKKDRL